MRKIYFGVSFLRSIFIIILKRAAIIALFDEFIINRRKIDFQIKLVNSIF